MNRIQSLIKEALSGYKKKDGCSCGCNTCHINENEVGNEDDIQLSQEMKLLPYTDLLEKLFDLSIDENIPVKLRNIYSEAHDDLLDASVNWDKEEIDRVLKKYNKFLPMGLNESK
jgi:hypothetical protein